MNVIPEQRCAIHRWLHYCGPWVLCGVITSGISFIGVFLGKSFVHDNNPDWSLVDAFAHWDGQHFKHIVERGYDYTPGHGSLVAFGPAYPVVAKALAWMGTSPVAALVIVANACCLAAFVLMGSYLQRRGLGTAAPSSQLSRLEHDSDDSAASYSLLMMGLLPTTFFFRMAYSESMFLCVTIVAMYGIASGWRIPALAFVVGFATAVRPVGVALLLPLTWYVWQTSAMRRQAVVRLAYAVPLGCWGLLAYMAYQYCVFGDPFAFYRTQYFWRLRTDSGFAHKVLSLASWEPIWSVYVPGAFGYVKTSGIAEPLFSLPFANPIYFVGTVALVAIGAVRRWLTSYEVLLSIPLLLIPYVTRSYEMNMNSQGRFAAVVFPVYIVLGHLFARLPTVVAAAILTMSAFLMAAYAALFGTGHSFI